VAEPVLSHLQAQITWGDIDSLPVVAASHFIVQVAVADQPNTNDVILTLGYLPPPVFLGTPEQQREAAAALDHVTVRPVARFIISRTKAGEMAQGVQQLLQALEAEAPQS
jgi:hypothetical protein